MRWPVVKLDEVAEIRLGRQRSPKNHSGADMRKYVRAANVGWSGLLLDDVKTMNFSDAEMKIYGLRPRDLLLNEASGSATEVGKPAIWNGELSDCAFQNTLLRVRPLHGLDSRYLLHFFKNEAQSGRFAARSRGVGIRHLGREALAATPLPVPAIEEQRRIADILDRADALRAKRREALVLLDDLTQSIFLDMFGEVAVNPRKLQVSSVGEVSSVVTDGEHQTPVRQADGIPLLSARNVQDGYLDMNNVDYIGLDEFKRLRRRLDPQAGDVLISCSGSIGRVAQVRDEPPFAMVRSAALVRPDPATITPTFLEHQLRLPSVKALMVQRANSSSQANLFQKDIRPLPILLPVIEEQREFDRRLDRVANTREATKDHALELQRLFASLQQRAFAGEL